MNTLLLIILSTFAMSLLAWVGLLLFYIKEDILNKLLLPLVSLSAGSLLAGALFHLIPESYAKLGVDILIPIWIVVGFSVFLLMELYLNWHHCHHQHENQKSAVSYLILLADGLHNFIGGLAIAGSFLVSWEVGIITWFAAAAHEIPQEFGDFGILLHGGWDKTRALMFNYVSAVTIIIGGILAYAMSNSIDTTFLLPFAAGNFIYIAAADLIPEISHSHEKRTSMKSSFINFLSFLVGVSLIIAIRIIFEG